MVPFGDSSAAGSTGSGTVSAGQKVVLCKTIVQRVF